MVNKGYPAYRPPQKTRRFGGKTYKFETTTTTVPAAEKEAAKYRKAGFSVRIVKSVKSWGRWNPNSRTLYIRKR